MKLSSLSSSPMDPLPPEPEAVLQGRLAAQTFGRLEGRLSALDPVLADRFAFVLVRDVLVLSLEDAGFWDAGRQFERWLAGGPPPPSNPQADAPPETFARAILAELSLARWAPLAQAAGFLTRAAPHLVGLAGAGRGPRDALAQASSLIEGQDGEGDLLCIIRMIARAAMRSSQFAPGQREDLPLDLDGQSHLVPRAAPRGAVWALNIGLGPKLVKRGALPVAIPMARAITAEALRADLEPEERDLVLARSLAACAQRLLGLFEQARRAQAVSAQALADLRRSSRAPVAHAALSALGPMSAAQLTRGLGVTRLGAAGMVDVLRGRGLVGQQGALWRALEYDGRSEGGRDTRAPTADGLGGAAQEVDAAMARLDALLAEQASKHD